MEQEHNHHLSEPERLLSEKLRLIENLYTNYEQEGKERIGIDQELKEGVALLLAMGMQTESSCWGYPERSDESDMLDAEQNLLPYIELSGYEPTDGLDASGEPIGYSEEQVDVACERMERDAATLQDLLEDFYETQTDHTQWIELRYHEGMPVAFLESKDKNVINGLDRAAQDKVIAQAHVQWKVFIQFIKESYLKNAL